MSKIGKFEGEPHWVELLWERALSGFSDEQVYDGSLQIDGFKIDANISELTGYDIDETRYVCLWENDDGFVSHMVLSYDELISCEGFHVEEPTGEWFPGIDDTAEDPYLDIGGESDAF